MPKRLSKPAAQLQRRYAKLTPNDRSEVDKFRKALHDRALMSPADWYEKHYGDTTGKDALDDTSLAD